MRTADAIRMPWTWIISMSQKKCWTGNPTLTLVGRYGFHAHWDIILHCQVVVELFCKQVVVKEASRICMNCCALISEVHEQPRRLDWSLTVVMPPFWSRDLHCSLLNWIIMRVWGHNTPFMRRPLGSWELFGYAWGVKPIYELPFRAPHRVLAFPRRIFSNS